jgi:hypothetical protein
MEVQTVRTSESKTSWRSTGSELEDELGSTDDMLNHVIWFLELLAATKLLLARSAVLGAALSVSLETAAVSTSDLVDQVVRRDNLVGIIVLAVVDDLPVAIELEHDVIILFVALTGLDDSVAGRIERRRNGGDGVPDTLNRHHSLAGIPSDLGIALEVTSKSDGLTSLGVVQDIVQIEVVDVGGTNDLKTNSVPDTVIGEQRGQEGDSTVRISLGQVDGV